MHQPQRTTLASVDVGGGISSMWNTFTTWVPKFVGFLAILAIGWVVAKIVARAVEGVLHRAGFERVMRRAGFSRLLEDGRYDGSQLCGLIAKYIVVLLVLQLAFGVFGSNPFSTIIHSILAWIPRGVVALALIVVAALVARVVRDIVANTLSGLSYGRTLGAVAGGCIMFLGVIAALGQAEIATAITGPVLTAALAAIVGVVIVGVGGGMIRPMQQRWERMLGTAEREAGNLRTVVRSSPGAVAVPGAAASPAASPGEAYTAGRSDGAQAAEEAARRAGQTPPSGSGGDEEGPADSGS